MSLGLRKSDDFLHDLESQYRWYAINASPHIGVRYLDAVDQTLQKLAKQPDLGRVRHFRHPDLHGLRSFRVEPPFDRHLIFYRYDEQFLDILRVMHGARN